MNHVSYFPYFSILCSLFLENYDQFANLAKYSQDFMLVFWSHCRSQQLLLSRSCIREDDAEEMHCIMGECTLTIYLRWYFPLQFTRMCQPLFRVNLACSSFLSPFMSCVLPKYFVLEKNLTWQPTFQRTHLTTIRELSMMNTFCTQLSLWNETQDPAVSDGYEYRSWLYRVFYFMIEILLVTI